MNVITNKEDYDNMVFEAAADLNNLDYTSSLNKFKKMVLVNPDNLKLHEVLFYLYLRHGEIETALEEMNEYQRILNKIGVKTLELKSFDEYVKKASVEPNLDQQCTLILNNPNIEDLDIEVTKIMQMAFVYMSKDQYDLAADLLSQYKLKMESCTPA